MAGYGLQFDNYIEGCDPVSTDYVALIHNDVCSFIAFQETDWIGDSTWHFVRVAFADGRIKITIDGQTTLNAQLANPDYTFTGIGFGAGTGFAYGDYQIANFRLFVSQ